MISVGRRLEKDVGPILDKKAKNGGEVMIMRRFKLWIAVALYIFSFNQICLAVGGDGDDDVVLLQNVFKCYSASNWYGKCETDYVCLVKRWSSQLPAPLRSAVYSEQEEFGGGMRHLFLFPKGEHTNQLVRLEVVCADSVEHAHQTMLEYFSACSAPQPFPTATKETGKVGDYCYFGYGKTWTSVMFVRNNVFVVLRSPTPSVSVQHEAVVVDKELIRLSSVKPATQMNPDVRMPDAKKKIDEDLTNSKPASDGR